jgi:hypothetical protein
MAEIKTRPTGVSIEEYIASRASDEQRADCKVLATMMQKATGAKPKMWGPSIVGFGSYHYTYDSGHSGEMCLTGFAIRGKDLVAYLLAGSESQKALLARLGKHRMGKSCLYFKRLADLDLKVLEQLIVESVKETQRRYPT